MLPNGLTLDRRPRRGRRAPTNSTAPTSSTRGRRRPNSNPMTIAAAQGSYVWDGDGNRLLDFSSQLVNTNIGHQHPKVVAAIQSRRPSCAPSRPQHANDARSEAARLIAERTPGDLNKIFFTNGGADANEHAVRMARLHTGRYKVLDALPLLSRRHRHRDQPDRRPATLAQRLRQQRRRALLRAVPVPLALPRHDRGSRSAERALAHLDDVIRLEGPSTIAAIVLESIPGTAGIMVPPPGLPGRRARDSATATASCSSPTR